MINHFRKHSKLTQKELSKKLKVSQSFVSQMEHLKRFPSNRIFLKLSVIFDVCPLILYSSFVCSRCKHKKQCKYRH